MPGHRQWWTEPFHEDSIFSGSPDTRDLKDTSANRSVSLDADVAGTGRRIEHRM